MNAALERAANETGFYPDGARTSNSHLAKSAEDLEAPGGRFRGDNSSIDHSENTPCPKSSRSKGGLGGNHALRRRTKGR